jgi:deazaflavin-dependent oxidoreductase (nitroreductase family)
MDDSEITLPPSGTRGSSISKPLRLVFKVLSPVGTLMFRMGRKIQGRPLARLESVGARTGKTRRVILSTFPGDGPPDSSVIVASNGGSARHPGWAYNLAANPNQVRIDTGEGLVAAEVELLAPEERDRMWNQVVDMAPGYRSYTEKTDREIPLFRLTPRR